VTGSRPKIAWGNFSLDNRTSGEPGRILNSTIIEVQDSDIIVQYTIIAVLVLGGYFPPVEAVLLPPMQRGA